MINGRLHAEEQESLDAAQLPGEIASHFVLLVYPFYHVIADGERATRLASLEGRWQPWMRRFVDADEGEDHDRFHVLLDDTYFFLPHVRTLLFPETRITDAQTEAHRAKVAAALVSKPLTDFAEQVVPEGLVRLTLCPDALQDLNGLTLSSQDGSGFHAGCSLDWVDVCIFPQGVGLLVLKARLTELPLQLDILNDFMYYARTIYAPNSQFTVPTWEATSVSGSFTSRDLVDFLVQGMIETEKRPPVVDPSLDSFVRRYAPPGDGGDSSLVRYTSTKDGEIYGSTFRLFSYACLHGSNKAAGACKQADGPFDCITDRILYELATVTRTTDPDYEPHPEGVKRLMDSSRIAIWANWQAIALHDNVAFLSLQESRMTTQVLPHNVESDYFNTYLLVLYQKMRMNKLAAQVMRQGRQFESNSQRARHLWGEFTKFRNHYWYPEVSFKPQGNELYKRFQQAMAAQVVYDDISCEVQEMQAYYDQQSKRRTERLVQLITFIGLPTSILSSIFGGEVLSSLHWYGLLIVTASVCAIGLLGMLIWIRFGKD